MTTAFGHPARYGRTDCERSLLPEDLSNWSTEDLSTEGICQFVLQDQEPREDGPNSGFQLLRKREVAHKILVEGLYN